MTFTPILLTPPIKTEYSLINELIRDATKYDDEGDLDVRDALLKQVIISIEKIIKK